MRSLLLSLAAVLTCGALPAAEPLGPAQGKPPPEPGKIEEVKPSQELPAKEGVEFKTKPVVRTDGGKARIEFEVNKATDVTLDILDADNKIVRHIGAGMLGANAPEPFTPGALAQSIAWDGTDDFGKSLPRVGLRARVRLGLGVRFDKFISHQERSLPNYSTQPITGLAVDSDRNLYVISGVGVNAGAVANGSIGVYSPQGKYLRTILPFPATADAARLRGVQLLSAEPNRLTPVLTRFKGVSPYLLTHRMTAEMTKEGWLIMPSAWHNENFTWNPRSLMVVAKDGSIPRERMWGPALNVSGFLHLALTPKQDSVYYSGGNKWQRYVDPKAVRHVVCKVGLGLNDKPELFAGEEGVPGDDNRHFNTPWGIATDGAGNVYVSDFGNDRIQVFDPQAKHLASVPVEAPGVIRVHPTTGAVYVVSCKGPITLKKYDNLAGKKLVWTTELCAKLGPGQGGVQEGGPSIALDPYGERAVIYVGSNNMTSPPWPGGVRRIEDLGDSAVQSDVEDLKRCNMIGPLRITTADPRKDRVYIEETAVPRVGGRLTSWRYDGPRNAWSRFWSPDTYMATGLTLGRDGLFYYAPFYTNAGSKNPERPPFFGVVFRRQDDGSASGKPVPFAATGESTAFVERVFEWNRKGNFAVTTKGEIYGFGYKIIGPPGFTVGAASFYKWDPDGRIAQKDLVEGLPAPTCLRLDSHGNLYLADNLKERPYPEAVARLPFLETNEIKTPDGNVGQGYAAEYGSVLKFGPEGGKVRILKAGEVPAGGERVLLEDAGQRRFAVSGLKGLTDMSIVPNAKSSPGGANRCWCIRSIYDIDLYDRLIVPDYCAFEVRILDANFNLIARFGGYDNVDNPGGTAGAPGPEIPITVPPGGNPGENSLIRVTATDAAFYVNDSRVIRAVPTYVAEGFAKAE